MWDRCAFLCVRAEFSGEYAIFLDGGDGKGPQPHDAHVYFKSAHDDGNGNGRIPLIHFHLISNDVVTGQWQTIYKSVSAVTVM